jgi:hypothetical protein
MVRTISSSLMEDAFLQELVAKVAQHLCLLSAETKNDRVGVPETSDASYSESIHATLELIWDLSSSSSVSHAIGSMGCIELIWGIAFQSDDDRVQELCFGALANMCLQTSCCSRLLDLPHAAAACVALCIPSAGFDIHSGSYVQALRLGRVILSARAAAPQRAALLDAFVDPKSCRQIVELLSESPLQSDSELQTVLVDFLLNIFECAVDSIEFAQVADNFISAGTFRAALQAVQRMVSASDIPQLARLLASCQNLAQSFIIYEECDADCIICACVAMLTYSSSNCCSVGMVRCPHVMNAPHTYK